jgi:hypothetical protein
MWSANSRTKSIMHMSLIALTRLKPSENMSGQHPAKSWKPASRFNQRCLRYWASEGEMSARPKNGTHGASNGVPPMRRGLRPLKMTNTTTTSSRSTRRTVSATSAAFASRPTSTNGRSATFNSCPNSVGHTPASVRRQSGSKPSPPVVSPKR